ncbi:hypothetical protein BT93_K0594 [Corymbia citriodora subsp. variegata]|nr:hypothetical protein BT93_K0594 [Corymbia citriodora subsp. variegata]
MSSVCISSCLDDARALQAPVRATYVNLYKWPESDAEFVRSVSSNGRAGDHGGSGRTVDHRMIRTRVVDSISCRQMYLRSYPLSREEDASPDNETPCFGRHRRAKGGKGDKKRKERRRRRKCEALKKVREASWTALFRIFHRLLSCSASVDVVD